MYVENQELQRLALFQRPPRRHIERRNEQLELAANRSYRVTTRQQFTIPRLPNEIAAPRQVLVPLGTFPKARRADLVVRDAEGTVMPVMLRRDAAVVLAALFLASWAAQLSVLVTPTRDDPLRRVLFRAMWASLIGIISAPEEAAFEHVLRLATTLDRVALALPQEEDVPEAPLRNELAALLAEEAFWTELVTLARTTTLLAQMSAVPDHTYVIETSHTDQLDYESIGWMPRLRRILPWLGVASFSIARLTANVGYARSLWVQTSVPEGIEIVRYFWSPNRQRKTNGATTDPATAEEPIVQGERAVIGWRSDQEAAEEPYLVTQTQIAPSASVVAACALAALTMFISAYIFEGIPSLAHNKDARATIISIAGLFAALPAAVAGGLAYRGEAFARHVTRGPRKLIGLLGVASALLAVVVSLKSPGTFTRWLSFSISIYSVFLFGVFTYVWLGPRWRKSVASRWKWPTRHQAPGSCRRWQEGSAIIFLTLLVFVCVSYGRCLFVLRDSHVFTQNFPHNVWRAWVTWF